MWLYHLNTFLPQNLPFGIYWRIRLAGAVSAFPRRGPLLLAFNHASFLDPWFIAFTLPRPVSYLMNERWYRRSKLWTFLFKGWGTIPIRTGDPQATVEDVCAGLAEERCVGIFPEGRISADGRMNRLRLGIAYMAAQSGAPVVAAGLRGNYELLPRSARFPRPGRMSIHLGAPRTFPGAPTKKPSRRDLVAFVHELEEELRRLAGQVEPLPPEVRWPKRLVARPRLVPLPDSRSS